MPKLNCWEFHMCGREPGGDNVGEFGICPAALEKSIDGINQGKKGGRACWAISGTFCEGEVQGTFAAKLDDCRQCSFFKLVQLQQGCQLQDTREIRRILILSDLKRNVGKKYKDHLNLEIRPIKSHLKNMPKVNCWEFTECGREPGGDFVDELGVCPASADPAFDGINDGEKAGRSCWAVSGTLCLDRVQEGFASKQCVCEQCDFYQRVKLEQENKFVDTRKIRQLYMHKNKKLQLRKYPEIDRTKNVNRNSTGIITLWD